METLKLLSKIFLAIGALSFLLTGFAAYGVITAMKSAGDWRFLGLLLLVIPAAFVWVALKVRSIVDTREALVVWLRESGEAIEGVIVETRQGYVKHSGRMIVHLTAKWEPGGDQMPWKFQSGAIDMARAHQLSQGDGVKIFIDSTDPKRYVFDLSDEAQNLCAGPREAQRPTS